MKENATISALMITFNEINNIDEVIDQMGFADEIIVVDSHSTDGTFDRLTEFPNVKVLLHEFKDFASQRNFALQQATCDWILFMDADERLSEGLTNEILDHIKNPKGYEAFKIKRHFMFNNKRMRFSGLQTDKVFRVFKNGVANYNTNQLVHEVLDFKGKYKVLEYPILHYSFSNYEDYKAKTEHYGWLKAQELFQKGKRPTWFHFMIRPAYKFLTNYLFRFGFLDGKEGYTICALNAYGVFFRYKALKKLRATAPEQ